jgi:hypothetical protein
MKPDIWKEPEFPLESNVAIRPITSKRTLFDRRGVVRAIIGDTAPYHYKIQLVGERDFVLVRGDELIRAKD